MGRKQNMIPPMMTGGGSVVPKVVGGLVLLALLALVIKHPGEAATWAKSFIGMVSSAVDGIATFFQQVSS